MEADCFRLLNCRLLKMLEVATLLILASTVPAIWANRSPTGTDNDLHLQYENKFVVILGKQQGQIEGMERLPEIFDQKSVTNENDLSGPLTEGKNIFTISVVAVSTSTAAEKVNQFLPEKHTKLLHDVPKQNHNTYGDCVDAVRANKRGGVFIINPLKKKNGFLLYAVCDDSKFNGGWQLIGRRSAGSNLYVRRPFRDYIDGFGSFSSDFYYGLDNVVLLTAGARNELLILNHYRNGTTLYARYDNFKLERIGKGYVVKNLGNYSGNAGDFYRYVGQDVLTAVSVSRNLLQLQPGVKLVEFFVRPKGKSVKSE